MLARAGFLMVTPEDRLVSRCRAGDVDAFAQLHAKHEAAIQRHAYCLLGSQEDALDACQETFVKAFVAIPKFRGECTLRVWLLRICTNVCRNQLRTQVRRRETSMDAGGEHAPAAPAADPLELVEQRRLARLFRTALDRLAPGHREIIVLRDLEDLSTAEIAAVIGCSAASVPVKLFRARARLKEQLQRLTREGD
ncbi:MAG: polymerase sigma factor, sigma-70 family [Armatimonadetes bacterium]|nr:polymerase sigma factor, sigma-70 family [Armatimonadota bacterium]